MACLPFAGIAGQFAQFADDRYEIAEALDAAVDNGDGAPPVPVVGPDPLAQRLDRLRHRADGTLQGVRRLFRRLAHRAPRMLEGANHAVEPPGQRRELGQPVYLAKLGAAP